MSKVVKLFQSSVWKKCSGFALSYIAIANEYLVTPKSTDEETRRKEFILNILLIGLIGFLIVLAIYVFCRTHEGASGVDPLYFTCIPLIFCFYLLISRKGFIKTSSILFIGTLYIGATYGIIVWGFGMHMSLLTYILIISMSSILLGTLAGFISTLAIGITLLSVSWLQIHQILKPDWYWLHEPDQYKAGQFVFVLLLITIVSWLANREIKRSLKRAHQSEENLRQERNQLEIRIAERTSELKKSQLEKVADMYKLVEFGRLSSGIFHDLMSPLNAVAICVEQLSKGTVAKGDIQKYVSLAVSASKRMHEFLNKASKQIKDHEIDELFDAYQVFTDASELLNYKARLQSVRLTVEPTEAYIKGNPLRFHQVANNLLSNAIDAFDNFDTANTIQKKVTVTFRVADQYVNIYILDNGSGIPSGNLDHIFEPFFTTKSVHKGTGIGLSITKSIVENEFKGSIKVESKLNSGTTFTISIPLSSPTHANLS